jgi:hypothetical protein
LPTLSDDPVGRHIFRNSSIIKSIDNGQTWTRDPADNYLRPMFPGKRFGAPYFVWYGKDGAAAVDQADRFVYAVSNNGNFENGDDYVLGRVSRSKLGKLSASDWSFYLAGDGAEEGSWTKKLDQAKPILSNPRRSGMTGMTYIEILRRYVMVVWHYRRENFGQAIKDRDLSTILEFYEAPRPWGPWGKFKTLETGRLGWYVPIIGQRFQSTVNTSSVKVFLYATGLTAKVGGGVDTGLYKLNYMPITLSAKRLSQHDSAYVGDR